MRHTTLLLFMAIVAGCAAGPDRPGLVVLPDMVHSVPYDAYDPNVSHTNGQTLALPPLGAVPMEVNPFLYGTAPEEAERAGRELVSPLAPSATEVARGKLEFTHKCQVCHGPGGQGDGPIIGRFPNPPSLLAEHARALPDGRIYHIISRGQGIMPSHAAQVLPLDRWRLVLYVRLLQAGEDGGRAKADLAPPAVTATPPATAGPAGTGGTR